MADLILCIDAEGNTDNPRRFIYRMSEHQLRMRLESCKPFFD